MRADNWTAEYSLIRVMDDNGQPDSETPEGADRLLDIVVLHTSGTSTLRALKTAARLAVELSGRVRVVAPRIVPYPLTLNEPQVPVSFTARQLRDLAGQAGVDVSVDIILCRDLITMLPAVLKPESLIVMGEHRSRWRALDWLDREYRLGQRLLKQGHQVVFADLN